MKSIIVAYDKNHGIGAANDLLWIRDLPADLKHFKEITTGHSIIMGRKTYESLGRPLPNRQNIVMSRLPIRDEGIFWANRIDDAYNIANDDQVFVIGGGQIYRLALTYTDVIYATEVDALFSNADVFFPEISDELWQEVSREHHEKDDLNKYNYDFVVYKRR
jgi:dihydrofolate reductase